MHTPFPDQFFDGDQRRRRVSYRKDDLLSGLLRHVCRLFHTGSRSGCPFSFCFFGYVRIRHIADGFYSQFLQRRFVNSGTGHIGVSHDDRIPPVCQCPKGRRHRIRRKCHRIRVFKIRRRVDHPFYDILLPLREDFSTEFFCNNLKTSALDLSRQNLFQFHFHILYTPSSRIRYTASISKCSRIIFASWSYCSSLYALKSSTFKSST